MENKHDLEPIWKRLSPLTVTLIKKAINSGIINIEDLPRKKHVVR